MLTPIHRTDARRLRLAYVALALADTVLAGSARPAARRVRFLTKPLLMPLLAASTARTSTAGSPAPSRARPRASPLRTPVRTAQACGWVGDVALLSHRPTPFLVGTGGFAAGHAAYIAGFHPLRDRTSRLVDERPARALALSWAASAPVLAVAASRREGLGLPVAAYSALLTAMAVAATRLSPSLPTRTRRLAAAGALTFLASDATLGVGRFVLADPPAGLERAVMATYTAAQLLLAEAAAPA
jgi:uncharacterized membrane protein YhhN